MSRSAAPRRILFYLARQARRCRWWVTAVLLAAPAARAERIVLPLDGDWSVAESVAADARPTAFDHRVAVPGLTRSARPGFPDVDQYDTHEYVFTMKRYGLLPASDECPGLGRTRQKRNYFWYSRTIPAPARRAHATLVVHKAQFGVAVWLNGRKLGESLDCFTANRFDATEALRFNRDNELLIRIGAHPGVMPDSAFWGSDGEKGPWTPGIYDRVELILADNPAIESVQVAPDLAHGTITVQTRMKNYGPAGRFELTQQVQPWKGTKSSAAAVRLPLELASGEEKTVVQTVAIDKPRLWTTDDPFLYVLQTGTGGDDCATRFGMREFRFDPARRVALLNGKVCRLRGASLTLHRFFGDPLCGDLPWNEAWVRRLLGEIPRQMNWNCFRVCIGPAPQRWLDIADEAGLLLQWEFPIWSDREPMRHKLWNQDDLVRQLGAFMRDSWNHPSVAIWDASNETHWDFLSKRLVPAVRDLDLSHRPWENGYEPPGAPGDPYEIHPYRFIDHVFGKPPHFEMRMLDAPLPKRPTPAWYAAHAAINNEYDWLWLHRDGTPTALTKKVFDNVLGATATAEQRRAFLAYCLAGLTEYWRAERKQAGVLYLAYLDGDLPNAFTCDNFRNVAKLEFDPHFSDYLSQAFKPLGVCIHFYQPSVEARQSRQYAVTLVNDDDIACDGTLTLAWQRAADKATVGSAEVAFHLDADGTTIVKPTLATPSAAGDYVLVATARCSANSRATISRRKVAVGP